MLLDYLFETKLEDRKRQLSYKPVDVRKKSNEEVDWDKHIAENLFDIGSAIISNRFGLDLKSYIIRNTLAMDPRFSLFQNLYCEYTFSLQQREVY